ncbi:MAG: FkbM family methyltransferase [Ginsengibacter sp.]
MRLSDVSAYTPVYCTLQPEYNTSRGAIVVCIYEKTRNHLSNKTAVQTSDNYCAMRNIHPDFLKLDADGNELRILQGAIKTLRLTNRSCC